MHAAFLALIWICVSVVIIFAALAIAGLIYVGLLIKRSGFSELFRRLSYRGRR